MANKLRALDWETKTALLNAMSAAGGRLREVLDERIHTGEFNEENMTALRADMRSLMTLMKEAGLMSEEFRDFILTAPAGSLKEALLSGAPTIEAKNDTAAAFTQVIASLIREGRLAGQAAAERLAVAGQLQLGAQT